MTDPLTALGVLGLGILSFIGWLVRSKYDQIDDLDSRLTKVETKLDVLGDIAETLMSVKTDVEVIKTRVEHVQYVQKRGEGERAVSPYEDSSN